MLLSPTQFQLRGVGNGKNKAFAGLDAQGLNSGRWGAVLKAPRKGFLPIGFTLVDVVKGIIKPEVEARQARGLGGSEVDVGDHRGHFLGKPLKTGIVCLLVGVHEAGNVQVIGARDRGAARQQANQDRSQRNVSPANHHDLTPFLVMAELCIERLSGSSFC